MPDDDKTRAPVPFSRSPLLPITGLGLIVAIVLAYSRLGVVWGVLIALCLWSVAFAVVVFQRNREHRILDLSALRRSESDLAKAQEIAHLGSWTLDLKRNELKWSDEVYRIFGLAPRQFQATYESFLEAVHPEDRESVNRAYTDSVKYDTPYNITHRVLRPNGAVRIVQEQCEHFRNEAGDVVRSVGTVLDITAIKQAEEDRDRLAHAIEQVGETILITDAQGAIQYINPAFERTTGYTREEVIGRDPNILRSEGQNEAVFVEMWETIRSGRTWEGEFINKKKDGSLYTEKGTITPVVNAAGVITNYVAVKRDITEQLRLQAEKERLEAQYHQAQKVESIGRLAGGVAHDLNNLLLPILGYSEMLLDDFGSDDVRRESIEEIHFAGIRARDLVRQLLAFGRKQTLEYRAVDMNQVVAGFEKLLRRTVREDIAIKIIPSSEVDTVMADIGQMEQVLMNLVVNASDAMPDGGRLTIEIGNVNLDEEATNAHPDFQPGRFVTLAISDTGCGINEETRNRLFEPFFSTKGELGTGLGLATVYGIVKQHGGDIEVCSEPGVGTTFKIYLPVSDRALVEPEFEKNRTTGTAGAETILLAEDNEQVRRLAQTILERQGYTLLVAEDGKQALNMLSACHDQVHLLITDVVMPEMNGKELYAKAAEKHAGLKVLYMSGYNENDISQDGALNEGTFLQKPFRAQALSVRVRQILEST